MVNIVIRGGFAGPQRPNIENDFSAGKR